MNEKSSKNNEYNSFPNESSNSSNEDRIVDLFSNQSKLPPKKRFGGTFGNPCLNLTNEPERQENPWIEKQQTINKLPGMEQNVQKPEARKGAISKGVIRHTSQPDTCPAFYYNYSINKKH